MISFWLVCMKFLRGTLEVKRTDRNELGNDCSITQNLKENEQKYHSETVTMETSQLLEMATETDCKMDSAETEKLENKDLFRESKDVSFHAEIKKTIEETEVETAIEEHESSNIFQEEAFHADVDLEELHQIESVASSVSDTTSSAGSVCETEIRHTEQEPGHRGQIDNDIMTVSSNCHVTEVKEPVEHSTILENDLYEEMEDSALEHCIKEEVLSDVSTEEDETSELIASLQEEIAAVSSDSEIDDKWRSIFTSTVNKENEDLFLGTNIQVKTTEQSFEETESDGPSPEEINQETQSTALAAEKNNVDVDNFEFEGKSEHVFQIEEDSTDSSSMLDIHQDELSEDNTTKVKEDPSQTLKQNPHTSSHDPTKKIPKDYCVVEESQNENVDMEHVDFIVARKQWLKMEELTKSQSYNSPVKQSKCQTGHSFMHTPVRNIEKPVTGQENREAHKRQVKDVGVGSFDIMMGESLGKNDHQQTLFSPSSEDSGLDDSSSRSAYDDTSLTATDTLVSPKSNQETPIEKEIRQALEREVNLRRERGISQPVASNEYVEIKTKPSLLHQGSDSPKGTTKQFAELQMQRDVLLECSREHDLVQQGKVRGKYERGLSQEIEEKRNIYQSQDQCKMQRSLSHGPLYHELSAENVIILEHDSFLSPARQCGKDHPVSPVRKKQNEWPSETANVIILETSNLIIRSASEFCLSAAQDSQENTIHNNPFFKLRSRSSLSLVDQEIKIATQREEELQRQRASLYSNEKTGYSTVLASPNFLDPFSFDKAEMPLRCRSSPSSPMKSAFKNMDQSPLRCDRKFLEAAAGSRRKSELALRWEAGIFTNNE
ncbi:mitotic interactor and substrate of PLK1-like isoform X3 [Acipenser ruthenus]|uniref:mitotic interactor and substrate of PLK1-like isoform X3 n=1 Tax=Acipenser ruthenus TaxID=7906 RepID=UPI002740645D|nr:mitotic interactor and substrate of PLK1-like isoform X3 [Acipenser ruthenus]